MGLELGMGYRLFFHFNTSPVTISCESPQLLFPLVLKQNGCGNRLLDVPSGSILILCKAGVPLRIPERGLRGVVQSDSWVHPIGRYQHQHISCGGYIMAVLCPECDTPIPVDPEEVEEGETLQCDECGLELEVVSTDPLELAPVEDLGYDDEDDPHGLDEDDE